MLNSVEIASFLIDFHRVCYHYSSSSMAKKTHTSPQKWSIAFMMPNLPPNNSGSSPTPDMPTHIPISRKSIRRKSRSLFRSKEIPQHSYPIHKQKNELLLQAERTRFNLVYSADGCDRASQIHFQLCKFTSFFSKYN